jgi:hypothetical protein
VSSKLAHIVIQVKNKRNNRCIAILFENWQKKRHSPSIWPRLNHLHSLAIFFKKQKQTAVNGVCSREKALCLGERNPCSFSIIYLVSMSLFSPANIKQPTDGRFGASFTPSHGPEAETPSKVKMFGSGSTKHHTPIPVAPKWTLSRPYLTLGHLSEPRGSFDGEETQPPKPPLGSFPLDVQEILVRSPIIPSQLPD